MNECDDFLCSGISTMPPQKTLRFLLRIKHVEICIIQECNRGPCTNFKSVIRSDMFAIEIKVQGVSDVVDVCARAFDTGHCVVK